MNKSLIFIRVHSTDKEQTWIESNETDTETETVKLNLEFNDIE